MWIGNSSAEELDYLVEVLDNEFVIGKGYHLSLTKRFPRTLNIENLSNIYLLKDAGKLLSSVVVKNFDWVVQDYKWKCAMIGMVYTIPEARGQGFSTNLMKYVQEQLLAREVDFAVLFTSIPEFYLRLGWLQRDIGVWGHFTRENDNSGKVQHKIVPIPINQNEIDDIELIRSQRVSMVYS